MTEATIRANLKTILDGVTDIGNVYDYWRWTKDHSQFLETFKATIDSEDVGRVWYITVTGMESEGLSFPGNRRVWNFVIRGYLQLNDTDETEKTAIALTEDVCDALDQSALIRARVGNPRAAGTAQIETFGHANHGNTLCHFIEITQLVGENTTGT